MNDIFKNIVESLDLNIIIKDKNNEITYYNNEESLKICKHNPYRKDRISYEKRTYNIKYLNIGDNTVEIYENVSQYEEEIKKLKKDYLTNLFNRHAMFEKISEIKNEAIINNSKYALIIGDIDFFKKVNDTYGHIIGDHVLKGLGNILIKNISNLGLVGRYGGEEFIIVIPNASKRDTISLIEKMRKEIEKTKIRVKYKDCIKKFKISMTFGITFSSGEEEIEELIANADSALYEGKNNGRNQTSLYKKGKL